MVNNSYRHPRSRSQRGASMVELSIIGGMLVLMGLFTLQLGLVYHAKTTLNYATFEAARIGAVNNARVELIKAELGRRLAPLHGGDGTAMSSVLASFWSSVSMYEPLNTKVEFLNPTSEAFDDWAVSDPDSGIRFIPTNHLRHQTYDVGRSSGLSLRDANLLKIQVTHGVTLRVPVVSKLTMLTMQLADPDNVIYYQRDQWPLQAVATVRMQSDIYENEVLSSLSDTIDSSSGDTNSEGSPEGSGDNGIDVAQGTNDGMDETADGNNAGDSDIDSIGNDDLADLEDQQQGPIEPEDGQVDCPEGYTLVSLATVNQAVDSAQPASSERASPVTPENMMLTSKFRQLMAMGYR